MLSPEEEEKILSLLFVNSNYGITTDEIVKPMLLYCACTVYDNSHKYTDQDVYPDDAIQIAIYHSCHKHKIIYDYLISLDQPTTISVPYFRQLQFPKYRAELNEKFKPRWMKTRLELIEEDVEK